MPIKRHFCVWRFERSNEQFPNLCSSFSFRVRSVFQFFIGHKNDYFPQNLKKPLYIYAPSLNLPLSVLFSLISPDFRVRILSDGVFRFFNLWFSIFFFVWISKKPVATGFKALSSILSLQYVKRNGVFGIIHFNEFFLLRVNF